MKKKTYKNFDELERDLFPNIHKNDTEEEDSPEKIKREAEESAKKAIEDAFKKAKF